MPSTPRAIQWVRNPSNGGYSIPLLDKGDTRHFYPDFLVWQDDLIFAIDPKAGHLLTKDAGRKLLRRPSWVRLMIRKRSSSAIADIIAMKPRPIGVARSI